jgi:hypothetical protein
MDYFSAKSFKSVFGGCLILIFAFACKDDYTSVVPYVPVNMSINPVNIIELNIPSGTYYFKDAGYGGIIILNNFGDNISPYLAFDATCTYEVSSKTRVKVIENGTGIATCPQCGSQFLIFGGNGTPIKGPAVEPLKQYRTNYSAGRIIVRN